MKAGKFMMLSAAALLALTTACGSKDKDAANDSEVQNATDLTEVEDETVVIDENAPEAQAAPATPWLAKAAANTQVKVDTTGYTLEKSGLMFKSVKPGKADGKKPKATDTVKVHYTGKLLDGTTFDSSVERGEPAEFPLNRVIPGWTEGLQLMTEGQTAYLLIPSNLAYGPQGQGPIPPNSPLFFEVELLEVE